MTVTAELAVHAAAWPDGQRIIVPAPPAGYEDRYTITDPDGIPTVTPGGTLPDGWSILPASGVVKEPEGRVITVAAVKTIDRSILYAGNTTLPTPLSRNIAYMPAMDNAAGITVELNEDGSLKLSGKSTVIGSGPHYPINDGFLLPGETYTLSASGMPEGYKPSICTNDLATVIQDDTGTFTVPVEGYATPVELLIGSKWYPSLEDLPEATAASVKIQLERGSTASEWVKPIQPQGVASFRDAYVG
ncbi:hypothetical protein [Bifidobacterium callitrichos]|uniref:Uncharacterized protein n=1 Tax=Bifidobacterium callitrichos DSM 23973 TaxID=1437609 RepID=A0A087ACU1_9BIFI|nr:hypothetical protein [Bifidobacterium callitrichos]KFI56591.1 hypothetical protein BCAL_0189 [Bifidobacterium callitrichos DSM 23973]